MTKLVVLHGANGSDATMAPLTDVLRLHVDLLVPRLVGHGGRPVPPKCTVEDQAFDVISTMDEHQIDQAFVFGYSFGGCVALYMARHFPHRVKGVATLATKHR